jgi:hypothetical protein
MTHLEANSSVQDVIAVTLDFCTACQQALSKADDNYVMCFTCGCVLCPNCHACPCDVYGVPVTDTGEAELLALMQTLEATGLLQKS